MKLTTVLAILLALSLASCQNESSNSKETSQEYEKKADTAQLVKAPEPEGAFRLELTTIDGESGLHDYNKEAAKVKGEVIRQLNGPDGSEYYLFKMDKPLAYSDKGNKLSTNYLIIGGRFAETPLKRGANKTVINVAIVKDETLANDSMLNFEKSVFAGMGEASEVK